MKETAYLCLQPTYMNQFQCDGSQCQSKCCKNWLIQIDGNTYQKYCGLRSLDDRKRITSQIRWITSGHKKQFIVMLRKDGSCPFLREDYFCDIQKNYGERFLSKTCATYPRVIHRIDDVMERGLTMSCPVAAKLVLLSKAPMEFEQVEIVENRPMHFETLNMKRFPLGEHLIDFQYSCISLLQNRRLTIDQRLILMGFFLEQAEELATNGRTDELQRLAESYASDQVAEGALEIVGAISLQIGDYLRCMFGMREALYGKDSGIGYRGEEMYLDALADLYRMPKGKAGEFTIESLQEIYEGYRGTAKELVQNFSYIFENCMVNEFFINVYPFRVLGSLRENYLYFLMSYKMMEFLTIALAVVRAEEPRETILMEGMSFFAGRMDHNAAYREHIRQEILRYREDMNFFMRALLDGNS